MRFNPVIHAVLAVLLPLCPVCALAQGPQVPEWMAQINAELRTRFAPGSVVVLRKDNLGLWTTANSRYIPKNTYVNGTIKPEFPSLLSGESQEGTARTFMSGEKLRLTGIAFERKGDGLALEFLSAPYHGVRFSGNLHFMWPKGSPPTPDQILSTISEVLDSQGSAANTLASTNESTATEDATSQASDLSVAGVKLGMTADEAIEALKSFDAWPVLKKRYASGHFQAGSEYSTDLFKETTLGFYGQLGASEDCKNIKGTAITKPPLLVAIIAARANRIHPPIEGPLGPMVGSDPASLSALSNCEWNGTPTGSKPGEDPEEVLIYLSPTPGSERVIGVSMSRTFLNKPTVEAVLASARRKYTLDASSTLANESGTYLSWRFDTRGNLIPEAMASRMGFSRGSGIDVDKLPGSANPNGGIGLDFFVGSFAREREIATSYSITLFRESDLAKFTQQAQAAQAAIDQQKKQDVLDKAKRNSVDIKF